MPGVTSRAHRKVIPGANRTQDILGLVGFLVASFAAGAIGSLLMGDFQPWYDTLAKPDWTPPGSVIGAVWSVLYVSMGVAAWLVWRTAGWRDGTVPLATFLAQLAFNAAWSGIFFGAHQLGFAFIEIVLLWLLVASTTALFFRVDRVAGALFVPYLAWVTFAGYLNWTLWKLNG